MEQCKLYHVNIVGRLSPTTMLQAWQVSGKGNYVATLDKHSLHLWSAEHPEQRIVLHSTKRLTVQPHTLPRFCGLYNGIDGKSDATRTLDHVLAERPIVC